MAPQFYTSLKAWRHGILLKVVTLSGRQRASAALTSGMVQMDIQKASYLSVEVDFAPLDAATEERARAHIENRSGQAHAVRMDQPSNIHTVTDFHLCHRSLFPTDVGRQSRIIRSWTFGGKGFFLQARVSTQPQLMYKCSGCDFAGLGTTDLVLSRTRLCVTLPPR
jgi:hypothetical protein